DGDPSVLQAIRLEAFEDRLRVMKDGGAWIHGDRSVWPHLGVMPATGSLPPRDRHVLAENLAKARVGEDAFALGGRHALGRWSDREPDPHRSRAHIQQSVTQNTLRSSAGALSTNGGRALRLDLARGRKGCSSC